MVQALVQRCAFFIFFRCRRFHRLISFLLSADFTSSLESLDPVGINIFLGSRLIPRAAVEKEGHELADFISSSQTPSVIRLGSSFSSYSLGRIVFLSLSLTSRGRSRLQGA